MADDATERDVARARRVVEYVRERIPATSPDEGDDSASPPARTVSLEHDEASGIV